MESLTDAIERFVKPTVDSGFGRGNGNGCGYGNGSGRGDGGGNGSGNAHGCGCGFGGSDVSISDSIGDFIGVCIGDGGGDGSVYGYGDVNDILSYCGEPVYYIDGIPTVIQKVKGNLAKGYVINGDLTTKSCYIAKGNGYFAHGDTFRDAQATLRVKIFENMDTEEAIDEFLKTFRLGVKYPAKDFYEWHHILTGSCEFGRNTFVKNHGIDLEYDTYTVEEFIEITRGDYGSDVIKQLAERVQNEK